MVYLIKIFSILALAHFTAVLLPGVQSAGFRGSGSLAEESGSSTVAHAGDDEHHQPPLSSIQRRSLAQGSTTVNGQCVICSTEAGNTANFVDTVTLEYTGYGEGTGYQSGTNICGVGTYPAQSTLEIVDAGGNGLQLPETEVGDTITLSSSMGSSSFGVLTFAWLGYDGSALNSCNVDFSCYNPVIAGDQIGPFIITAGRGVLDYGAGCEAQLPTEPIVAVPICDVGEPCDICEDGAPDALHLQYLPMNSGSSVMQDIDGGCLADLDYPDTVDQLIVGGMRSRSMNFFRDVGAGAVFVIDTTGVDEFFFDFDSDFSCSIHTSCSVQLETGMQVGPFRIVGSENRDGTSCLEAECITTAAPTTPAPTTPLPTPAPTIPVDQTIGTPSEGAPTEPTISAPTPGPTMPPSSSPSAVPSGSPSSSPSASPSASPSFSPSSTPSFTPSATPSSTPSASPSNAPTVERSSIPSPSPSSAPTDVASSRPSASPSSSPSPSPSTSPSAAPTGIPTIKLTVQPTPFPVLITDPPVAVMMISGFVSEDLNGDDQGDEALPGVLITLSKVSGEVVATTLTNDSGYYSFIVDPATYIVTQENLLGFADVSDRDEGDPNSILVETMVSGMDMQNNFVDKRLLSISGAVMNDETGDEVGESGIEGVLVSLKANTGAVIATTLTSSDGSYVFGDVPPGEYTVTETNPAGSNDVSDIDGADENSIIVILRSTPSTGNVFVDTTLTPRPTSAPSICSNLCPTGERGIAPIFEDFEEGPGEWSGRWTPAHQEFTGFLGPYTGSDEFPKRTFILSPSVTSAVIQFDFYEIDGWDGDNMKHGSGSDSFMLNFGSCFVDFGHFNNVAVVGGQIDEGSMSGLTSCPGGQVSWFMTSEAPGDFGFGDFQDQKHTFVVTVPGSLFESEGGTTVLKVEGSWTLLDTEDESVGLDNFCLSACQGAEQIIAVPTAAIVNEATDSPAVAPLGNVAGSVFVDTDDDSEGEDSAERVLVTLFDDLNNPIRTTLTDSNGNYFFPNVEAQLGGTSYTIEMTTPSGFISITNVSVSVRVTPGDTSGFDYIIEAPSSAPSASPSNNPSVERSAVPSPAPSSQPTEVASESPSASPLMAPACIQCDACYAPSCDCLECVPLEVCPSCYVLTATADGTCECVPDVVTPCDPCDEVVQADYLVVDGSNGTCVEGQSISGNDLCQRAGLPSDFQCCPSTSNCAQSGVPGGSSGQDISLICASNCESCDNDDTCFGDIDVGCDA